MSHNVAPLKPEGDSSPLERRLPGEDLLLEGIPEGDLLAPLRECQATLVREGLPIINLSMVNPDVAPPRPVLDRLLESVTKMTMHRYAVSRGIRRLREAFALKYVRAFGVTLDPETQVCACLGSKDATFHALRAVVKSGDRVVVGSPAYPAHLAAVALAGGQRVPWMPESEPQAAAKSLHTVLQSSGARVVLLNMPSNPSGMVVSKEWWAAIGTVCAGFGAVVINDFVYGEMCFSGVPAPSALSMTEQGVTCVEVFSLSKSHNIPGWRVGALLGDAKVLSVVARLKAHSDYGLFLPLQHAAAFALTTTEDLVRPTVSTYERRIRVLSAGLQRMGWQVAEAKAGACVWARFPREVALMATPGIGSVSVGVAHALLKKHAVLVSPGVVFGDAFDDHIRFAAVVSEEKIRDVLCVL